MRHTIEFLVVSLLLFGCMAGFANMAAVASGRGVQLDMGKWRCSASIAGECAQYSRKELP